MYEFGSPENSTLQRSLEKIQQLDATIEWALTELEGRTPEKLKIEEEQNLGTYKTKNLTSEERNFHLEYLLANAVRNLYGRCVPAILKKIKENIFQQNYQITLTSEDFGTPEPSVEAILKKHLSLLGLLLRYYIDTENHNSQLLENHQNQSNNSIVFNSQNNSLSIQYQDSSGVIGQPIHLLDISTDNLHLIMSA